MALGKTLLRAALQAVAPTGYSAVVLADSPSGYWRLGEASATPAAGNAIDASGNAKHGTYGDGSTSGTIPTLGVASGASDGNTAATFDGAAQLVGLPDLSVVEAGDVTYEAWFKSTSGGLGPTMVGEGNSGNSAPFAYVRLLGGAVEFFIRDANSVALDFATSSTFNDGSWHHAVVTLTGTGNSATATIYVDGNQEAQQTQSNAAFIRPVVNTGSIGALRRDSDGFFFPGSLDEVAIYPSALSSARIAAHFAAR